MLKQEILTTKMAPNFSDEGLVRQFQVNKLHIRQYESRDLLGRSAAKAVAELMRTIIVEKGRVRMAFPSAMSHADFYKYLVKEPDIDWGKLYAFYVDEYAGLPINHSQSLCTFLTQHFISKIPGVKFYPLNGVAPDQEAECRRYAELLESEPIDIMMLGIGESGHLAFIDPPYCDFNDPQTVKITRIDDTSFEQMVHDGCFENPSDVPRYAYSLTVPACLRGTVTVSCVPTTLKAKAIKALVEGPITTELPASILQKQENAWVLIDNDSASLLSK